MNWRIFDDADLIDELNRRGYVVHHKSESRRPLSWNRTAPFPDGVDFRKEAVENLRNQITDDMISFEVTPGGKFGQEIHRAILRVL